MEKQSLWLLGVIPAVFGISEDVQGKVVHQLVNRPLSCFVRGMLSTANLQLRSLLVFQMRVKANWHQ